MLFSLSLPSLLRKTKKNLSSSQKMMIFMCENSKKKKQKENGELAAIEPNMCGDYSH